MITYNIVREGFSWCVYKDNHNLLAVADTYGEAVEICLNDIEKYDVMDFEILSPKAASKKTANMHLDFVMNPDNNEIVFDTLVNAYLSGKEGDAISTLGSTDYDRSFVSREFEYDRPIDVYEFCAVNNISEDDSGMLFRWADTTFVMVDKLEDRDVYLAIEDKAQDIVDDFDRYNLWEGVE